MMIVVFSVLRFTFSSSLVGTTLLPKSLLCNDPVVKRRPDCFIISTATGKGCITACIHPSSTRDEFPSLSGAAGLDSSYSGHRRDDGSRQRRGGLGALSDVSAHSRSACGYFRASAKGKKTLPNPSAKSPRCSLWHWQVVS